MLNVLNWISGGLLGSLAGPMLNAYKLKLSAEGDTNKLVAEERHRLLELEADSQRGAREIRKATAGYWEMRLLTFLFAAPFVIHLWLVAMDTCFRLGWRIAKFPEPFATTENTIVLSFFGITVAGAGLRALAGAIAYRK